MEKTDEELILSPQFRYLTTCYDCALHIITTKFNVLNSEFALAYDRQPIIRISSRLKQPESIVEKLHRYGFPVTLESVERNIEDVAGVRVICSFFSDIYRVADALTKQDDVELLYVKDYIKNPKESGYTSLHLFVSIPVFFANDKRNMRVEVQLRTIAMDTWASLEHQLRYKKDREFTESMSAELKLCADLSGEIDRRMDDIRRAVGEE